MRVLLHGIQFVSRVFPQLLCCFRISVERASFLPRAHPFPIRRQCRHFVASADTSSTFSTVSKVVKMEGVLPKRDGLLPTARVTVPCLPHFANEPEESGFYEFPRLCGVPSTDDVESLLRAIPNISSLASFMQSWLFFKLLSEFLLQPVDRCSLGSNGFIDLDKGIMHSSFQMWKTALSRISRSGQKVMEKKTNEMLHHALIKSEMIEEAANSMGLRNDEFDSVALSVKLLISMLFVVTQDTFANFQTPWASRRRNGALAVTKVFKFALRFFRRDWGVGFHFLEEYRNNSRVSGPGSGVLINNAGIIPLRASEVSGGRATMLLIRILEQNGWCPYRARQLCHSYDYLTVNALAGLKRNETLCADHRRCMVEKRCTAYDIDTEPTSSYPFRHECDGACEFVRLPYEEIARIIRTGGIPIVSCNLDGPPELEIIPRTPRLVYTAISHVWSDGRGNPKENALPLCQLQWLRKKIRQSHMSPKDSEAIIDRIGTRPAAVWPMLRQIELFEMLHPGWFESIKTSTRVFFWMDTLCIPVCTDPEKAEVSRELRLRAIKQITPIFAGATHTLILENCLQNTSSSTDSSHSALFAKYLRGDEFSALVLSSKWMERGWTLEEGCLSRECVFQFSDRPYHMISSLAEVPTMKDYHSPLGRLDIHLRHSLVMLLRRQLFEDKKQVAFEQTPFKSRWLAKKLRQHQFVRTWNALLARSTTRPSDGVLILANLLDLNVYSLKDLNEESKLKRVIQSCEELPLSLLFNTGPRLEILGHPELGWIPSRIAGAHLTTGASMRKLKSSKKDDKVTIAIERSTTLQQSIIILATRPEHHILRLRDIFRLRIIAKVGEITRFDGCVAVIQQTAHAPETGARSLSGQNYSHESLGICLVIDSKGGTCRSQGYVARGACLLIHARGRKHFDLAYSAPMIILTSEQCEAQNKNWSMPMSSLILEPVSPQQKMFMHYGK
ncbi:Heterokaryon incompatibility [Penicillium occitanis (nom. inval.)]|nr:hypothetical protein PENOC_054970 [Penicillium occitanis (nom. inval.)]PCH01148.1 Heterokaryon incompatibility [Penicillium occitanis (nom. inval.)]